MSGSLDGKVALVTGAGRGIGREIALRAGAAGAIVIVADIDQGTATATAGEIETAGGRAQGIVLDVSSDASVEAGIGGLLETHGRIPLLVNNAGITRDNLLLRMKKDEWDVVVATNLTGAFRVCRAVVPSMVKARYGRIVNVSSVVARFGNPGQANYAASKAGLEGLTRSLARELAARNITVNCVAPGFIDTDMTRKLGEEARQRLMEQVPARRLGTPADVAAAVLFLLGEDASYVTGHVLAVNGGMHM